MSFTELQSLARRLGLRSALNLDGGGSTTMVVQGQIVNHPSDATGPRPVSDAILVFPQKQ
jgi:exopolysaccharide biosynthesis protein